MVKKLIWTYGFVFSCLLAIPVVYRLYRELRTEIVFLPRAGHPTGIPHALRGASLKAAIELPDHVRGVTAIVQFASPSCPMCYQEMRDLERAYQHNPFPYVCLYEVEAEEQMQKFLTDFGHLHIQPIEPETARMLGITVNPFVVLIDANSVVSYVEYQLQRILPSIMAAKRGDS